MPTVTGSPNADTLPGSIGNDTMLGLAGNDTLFGSLGADQLDGGDDTDYADYSNAGGAVTVNLTTGTGSGDFAAGDTYISIENVTGSGFADLLTGSSIGNLLDGGVGNDTLIGGLGADTLIGGTGIDTADYSSSIGAVIVNLVNNNGLKGDAQGDVLVGIENVTGSAGNDSLVGDDGNNVLVGLDGNDTIVAGLGNDTINSGTGNDSLNGGGGDDVYFIGSSTAHITEASNGGFDTVFASVSYAIATGLESLTLLGTDNIDATGNSGANTLTGNAGENALSGGSGNDLLNGGDGNDILNGDGNTDTLVGGNGDDIYFVDSATDVVDEGTTDGHDIVFSTQSRTLSANVEDLTLTLSVGASGTGNDLDNIITGNTGSNLLSGAGGDDTIFGGQGNDTLDGGSGANVLTGGVGSDTYIVGSVNDQISEDAADAGIDTVKSAVNFILGTGFENLALTGTGDLSGEGNTGDNSITGNAGANALFGDDGIDLIFGGAGADTIDGGTGADSMTGGLGADVYLVNDIGDKTIEGATVDIDTVISTVDETLDSNIENLTLDGTAALAGTGNTLDNTLTGNSGDNMLKGASGDDTIIGNLGNDTLDGGDGDDSMTGGAGNDVYLVNSAMDAVVELANGGTDTVVSTFTTTLSENVEILTLLGGIANLSGTGNAGANLMTGNDGDNVLSGLGGADSLVGGLGNDLLDGGTGVDTMTGGDGNDTYVLSTTLDQIVEATSGGGIDLVQIAFSYTLADGLENLTLTGIDNLNGTGNAAANILTGTIGNNSLLGMDDADTLTAGDGNDTLNGGTGADLMSGGKGTDTYFVDNVGDIIQETSSGQQDFVISTVSFTLATNVENLNLAGAGNLIGTGNALANIMSGTGGANALVGLAGNDTILGGAGADTLDGGLGSDSMVGGNGNDTYFVNAVADILIESIGGGHDTVITTSNLTLGANLDVLILAGNSNLNGVGNADGNELIGNAGSNRLTGLDGADTLTGGDGADRFIFNGTGGGSDVITDFNGLVDGTADGDVLQFVGVLVGTFAYVGTGNFTGGLDNTEARIASGGRLIIDSNGDGTGDLTLFLTGLTSATQLTASDFLFS